jgi:hypothetical protein
MARSTRAAMERTNTRRHHQAASHTRVATKIATETRKKSTNRRVVRITRAPTVIKIERGLIRIKIKFPVARLRIRIGVRTSIPVLVDRNRLHRRIRAQRKTRNAKRHRPVTHHQKIRIEIVTSTKVALVLAQRNTKVKTKIVKKNVRRININPVHHHHPERTKHRRHHITRIQQIRKLSLPLRRNQMTLRKR